MMFLGPIVFEMDGWRNKRIARGWGERGEGGRWSGARTSVEEEDERGGKKKKELTGNIFEFLFNHNYH